VNILVSQATRRPRPDDPQSQDVSGEHGWSILAYSANRSKDRGVELNWRWTIFLSFVTLFLPSPAPFLFLPPSLYIPLYKYAPNFTSRIPLSPLAPSVFLSTSKMKFLGLVLAAAASTAHAYWLMGTGKNFGRCLGCAHDH